MTTQNHFLFQEFQTIRSLQFTKCFTIAHMQLDIVVIFSMLNGRCVFNKVWINFLCSVSACIRYATEQRFAEVEVYIRCVFAHFIM